MRALPRWTAPVCTVLVAGGLGWYLGVVAYSETLRAVFGQALSRGDATAVRAAVAIAFLLTAPFTVPAIVSHLDRRIQRASVRPLVGFIAGAVAGLAPAMLIALFWSGGRISALFRPEFPLMLVATAVLNGIVTAGASLHSRFWARLFT